MYTGYFWKAKKCLDTHVYISVNSGCVMIRQYWVCTVTEWMLHCCNGGKRLKRLLTMFCWQIIWDISYAVLIRSLKATTVEPHKVFCNPVGSDPVKYGGLIRVRRRCEMLTITLLWCAPARWYLISLCDVFISFLCFGWFKTGER